MAQDVIFDQEYFNPFGKQQTLFRPNRNIFSNFVKRENDEQHLTTLMTRIMNDQAEYVNQMDVDRALLNLVSSKVNVNLLIIGVFDNVTEDMADKISNLIMSKQFTIKMFIDMYDTFVTRSRYLRTTLRRLDDYFKLDNDKSLFHIVKNYIFYRNVLNRKYRTVTGQVDSNNDYLYTIMLNMINKNDINEIMNVVKFFNFYSAFSRSTSENTQDMLFNKELTTILNTNCDIISPQLIDIIIKDIDDVLRKIAGVANTEDDVKSADIERVVDYVKMCVNMGDKIYFIMNYIKALRERLMSHKTNLKVENNLADTINAKVDIELYVKMRYNISDMLMSEFLTEKYQTIELTLQDPKYASIKMNTLNRKNMTFTVLNDYAWDDSKYIHGAVVGRLNEPLNIAVYLDIFTRLFNNPKLFKDRVISYNYEESTGVVELIFGEKTYTVYATLLQVVMLSLLNIKGTMTAKEISEELGTPLKNLNDTFNSLLGSKIIIRDDGDGTMGTSIKFEIDKDWKCNDIIIDLVSAFLDSRSMRLTGQLNKPSFNETVCKAKFLAYLIDNSNATFEQIFKYAESENLGMSVENVKQVLNTLQTSGSITESNGKFNYVSKSSMSDSEDDDEDNDNDNHSVEATAETDTETNDINSVDATTVTNAVISTETNAEANAEANVEANVEATDSTSVEANDGNSVEASVEANDVANDEESMEATGIDSMKANHGEDESMEITEELTPPSSPISGKKSPRSLKVNDELPQEKRQKMISKEKASEGEVVAPSEDSEVSENSEVSDEELPPPKPISKPVMKHVMSAVKSQPVRRMPVHKVSESEDSEVSENSEESDEDIPKRVVSPVAKPKLVQKPVQKFPVKSQKQFATQTKSVAKSTVTPTSTNSVTTENVPKKGSNNSGRRRGGRYRHH